MTAAAHRLDSSAAVRRRLGRAAALAVAAAAPGLARAATDTWSSTAANGTAGSTQDQLWLNPNNWTGGVPGPADVGLFSTTVPKSNTAYFDFTNGNISAGAVVDSLSAALTSPNLTLTTASGTPAGNLVLNGATVTVPFAGGTETVANVVVSATDSSVTQNKNLTFGSGVNLALTGASNVILGYQGAGNATKNTSGLPVVSLPGNIVNGTAAVAAGVTFLGGGTGSADGGELSLAGTNTFTGGLTIGNVAGTQGGVVLLANPYSLPTTGTVTVNEQGQLAFGQSTNGAAYSAPGQTLVLNGIGIGKNISGAIRPTGGTAAAPVVWAGNIQFGTSAAADLDNGMVLTTVASAGSYFKVTGNLTGGGWIEQGGGVFEVSGTNNTYSGGTQVGNGGILVDAGSALGPGDVILFQTSTNNPTITLNNATQTIANLRSSFTGTGSTSIPVNASGFVQNLALNGTALTVTQPANTSFGYGAVPALTSGINGAGSLTLNSTSGHTLTLTGPNTYTGGTTVAAGTLSVANNVPGVSGNYGSATGTGPVVVNAGGVLASGGYAVPAGFAGTGTPATAVTGGTITGAVTVNAGGTVAPGGVGGVGSLAVGGLTANAGSTLDFGVNSGTAGNYGTIADAGPLTLPAAGTETVNVTGSKLAFGTFNLITAAGGLTNAGTAFTLGTTPGGANRTYALSTSATGVVLTITNTGTSRIYSTDGSANLTDGPGTVGQGTTDFFLSPNTPNAPYDNASNADAIFGNGGNGGQITLSTNLRVGGNLILGGLAAGQSYTFGTPGSANTITTVGGIAASNTTLVNAPVVLGGSQPVSTDAGVTLTLAGGTSESVAGSQLTKAGSGTLVVGGTGTYTGGTVISAGTVQATTAALPAAGGVVNNGVLDLDQPTAGTYAGLVSGTGSLQVNATGNAGTVTLTNVSNSYAGTTTVAGGTLVVPDARVLGTGGGGLVLAGGTLAAGGNLSFPLTNGSGGAARTLTLATGTTSTVAANGYTVTFGQNVTGSGNLNVSGGGTVTLAGVPSTTVIGNVAVAANTTLAIAPPANIPSFGFSASTTDGTVAGNIVVQTPIELRLYGGNFTGGGTLTVVPSGVQIVSRGTTIVGDAIVLNPANIAGYGSNIGANTGNSLTINGPITGPANVAFTGGGGNVVLGGTSTYTGTTRIDTSTGGSVALAVNNALPTATDVTVTSSGTLDLNGFNQSVNSLNATSATATVQSFAGSGTSVLTVTGATAATYAGVLQDQTFGGTLGLTLNGTGSLALPDPELLSGPIAVLGGRLDITGIGSDSTTGLGAASSVTVGGGSNGSNAQLRFNGVVGTVSYATANHPGAVAPTITLASLGGYTAPGSANVSTGAIRVSGNSAVTLPDNVAFAATAAITVTDTSTLTLAGTLSGPGTLVSNGTGTTTLTGANAAYAGGTDLEAGTLNVSAGSALGTGPLTVNNLLNSANGSAGLAVVLNLANAAQAVASLSGTITPPTTGANTATVNLAGTALTVTQTTAGTFAGTLTGTGSLTKAGPATLTLAGSQTYTGLTTVAAGTLTFPANAGSAVAVRSFAGGLSITGGSVVLPTATATAGRTLLVAPSVSITGTGRLDLANGDLDVPNANATSAAATLTTLTAAAKAGFAAGTWTGNGLASSVAAADTGHLTAVGVIPDVANGTALYTIFDGQPVSTTDVLARYTYYGDTNLDGTVNAADYTRVDAGFVNHLTGWLNGDFNYDGVVDGTDYALMDNAFNQQAGGVAAPAAVAVASPAAVVAGPAAVPEPTAATLLAAGGLAGLLRRRRPARGSPVAS